MINTFLRSSLLTTVDLCEGRAFIEYNIGRRGETNQSALIGSVVHAVMEALALVKLSQQNNHVSFTHKEFGEWPTDHRWDTFKFLRFIYDKYDKENPEIFSPNSYNECYGLIEQALSFSNKRFDPRNSNIFLVEHYFDIEINKPWAFYSYDTSHGKLEGYLRLKGTVDLIIKESKDTLHIIDYKTGKYASNWATGEEKTDKNIKKDKQLQFYYYAIANLFPEYENILITLYFTRLDKPFTALFERSELPLLEKFIRSEYEYIKSIKQPNWLVDTQNRWKCKTCPHFTNKETSSQTVCNFFRRQTSLNGLDKTMDNFGDYSAVGSYGRGASSKERD